VSCCKSSRGLALGHEFLPDLDDEITFPKFPGSILLDLFGIFLVELPMARGMDDARDLLYFFDMPENTAIALIAF
jgi:hypothetical protein